MLVRLVRLRLLVCVFLSLAWFLPPSRALGQAEFVNGHLVVAGHENSCSSVVGTDSYACNLLRTSTTPAYEIGACYQFIADVANTGPATVNFSSMGVQSVTKVQGGVATPLVDNDIRIGHIVKVCWDGATMQCQNCNGNVSAGSGVVNGGAAGGPVAYYPAAAATVDDSTGLRLDGANVLTLQARTTTMAADIALLGTSDGPIIACTAGGTSTTARLPVASTTTQGFFRLVKVDAGAGACVLAPNGSDTLNGVNASKSATTQWSYVEVWRRSTTDWQTIAGVTSINLATDVTGLLPAANGGLGWSDTTVSGNTHKLTTMGAGNPATDDCAKWDANDNLVSAGAPCGSGPGGVLSASAERVTAASATATLGTADGPIVACTATADVVLTLPTSTVADAQRHWTIIKIDAGAGKCLVRRNGSDTINGTATDQQAATQWSRVDLDLAATVPPASVRNWSAIATSAAGVDVTGTAPTLGQSVEWASATAIQAAGTPLGTGSYVKATGAAINLGSATNLPVGAITGLGTGIATMLATPTMANFNTALSDANIFPDSGSAGIPNRTSATASTAITGSTVDQVLRVTAADTFAFGALNLTTAAATTGNIPAARMPTTVLKSVYIPAGSMQVSGSCLLNDPATLLANGPKLPTITCTKNNADSIEFDFVSPDAWNAGTLTVQLHAFNSAAVATTTIMHFAGQCVSSGDAVTAHATTGESPATLTWTNATNREVWATTGAITLQGSCVAGDHIYMRGQIDAASTIVDISTVKILGVKVRYSNVAASEFTP
jgi:hypothetical protein